MRCPPPAGRLLAVKMLSTSAWITVTRYGLSLCHVGVIAFSDDLMCPPHLCAEVAEVIPDCDMSRLAPADMSATWSVRTRSTWQSSNFSIRISQTLVNQRCSADDAPQLNGELYARSVYDCE